MRTDVIKIPVEYTVITTSDWTQFEIVEGGWWESLHTECKAGEDKLKQQITTGKTCIRLDKQSGDETLVIAYAKGYLNIKKDFKKSNIKYKITKGDMQSTMVLGSTNRKKLSPMLNKRSDDWSGLNPVIFDSPAQEYLHDWTKNKVFIIHGKDRIQQLLLNKFLNKHGIDAIIFDDLSDKGKTIMEQIEYIQNNVSFAFAILTPDDVRLKKKRSILPSALKPQKKVYQVLGALEGSKTKCAV